jgi:hypothetical protein
VAALTFADYILQPLFNGCEAPLLARTLIAATAVSKLPKKKNCTNLHDKQNTKRVILTKSASHFPELLQCQMGQSRSECLFSWKNYRSTDNCRIWHLRHVSRYFFHKSFRIFALKTTVVYQSL